ncbi:type II secretion system protein GspL [Aestuariivita sp.]|uniref:type II secretion system protein GspL n=1 Tax=Aestuariivita sp. TaxID=1872407 RepID=UPI00216D7AD3|nr:type II secretion system protein GspL [Aestuariivita sp.]MCE8009872.1 hypothetical protein [Aestuariivita sp.]
MKTVRPDPPPDGSDPPVPELKGVRLVPGAQVPLLTLELPDGLRGQAREQVALRQLRDQVGLAGDRIEIRPYATPGEGEAWQRVMVVDKGSITGWRAEAGPGCVAVLPDYLALPAAPDLWVLAQQQGTIRVRMGVGDGFSAEPDLVPALLAAKLEEDAAAAPRAVLCPDPLPPGIAAFFEARGLPLVTGTQALAGLDVAPPRVLAHGELAADLRSDPRAARARLRQQVLLWRWPLVLGLVAAGLWAATQIIETGRLEAASEAQRAEATRLARTGFIPTGPILDLRQQVSRALADQRAVAAQWQGRVAPLALIRQAADVIAAEGAVPEVLSYDRALGLSVTVRVADFAAVDRLEGALRVDGLAVRVTQSQASGGSAGVRAELRIGPQGEDRP